jgi:hypothetical protein
LDAADDADELKRRRDAANEKRRESMIRRHRERREKLAQPSDKKGQRRSFPFLALHLGANFDCRGGFVSQG